MHDIPLNERVIFALDCPTHDEARGWVERLDSRVRFFKVGLELFMAGGEDWRRTLDFITGRGNRLMVDLKFFDIPETVARAVSRLRDLGPAFVTLHANEPAVRAAAEVKGELNLLAVTVLTSFGEEDLRDLGIGGDVADLVLARARKAVAAGCDGVVASALEARRLKTEIDAPFVVVTPGIRPNADRNAARADDQRRVATPRDAVARGADYLVIGRPIRQAADPLALAERVQEEIRAGLADRIRNM